MAMLAEPRRKTKWTLNPRGKLWSEDSNKFGQKLLEKMGWKAGKGLGAKEQGITSHIRVQVKSDNTGVGFKGKDTDWCKHQSQFDEVLASLSRHMGGVGIHQPSESLEERSKASKARLHYHKFTRGKDVSKYSSKDLGCILGVPAEILKAKSDEGLCPVEDIGTEDDSFGVKTIVGGSIEDYLNRKQGLNNQSIVIERKNNEREGGCGKKRKGGGNLQSLGAFEGIEDTESPNMVEEDSKRKKKMKLKGEEEGEVKKISKPLTCTEESEFLAGNLMNFAGEVEGVEKGESKSKKKSSVCDSDSIMELPGKGVCGRSDGESLPQSRIKKKNRKAEFSGSVIDGKTKENISSEDASSEDAMLNCTERIGDEDNHVGKRKKKKRMKLECVTSHVDEMSSDLGSNNVKKSKKKKSSDEVIEDAHYLNEGVIRGEVKENISLEEASSEDAMHNCNIYPERISEEDNHVGKRKKKKRVKLECVSSHVDEMCSDLVSNNVKKSKKKKSSDEVIEDAHLHECVLRGEMKENISSEDASSEDAVRDFTIYPEIIGEKGAGEEDNYVGKRKKKKCVKLECVSSHVDEMSCDLGSKNGKDTKTKNSSDYVEGDKYYPSGSFNGDGVLESDHILNGTVKQVCEDEVKSEEVDISKEMKNQVKRKKKKVKSELEKHHYHSCLDSKERDAMIISSSCKMFLGANLGDIQGYGAEIERTSNSE